MLLAVQEHNVIVILDFINTIDLIWFVPLWKLVCGKVYLSLFLTDYLFSWGWWSHEQVHVPWKRLENCFPEQTVQEMRQPFTALKDSIIRCPRHLGRNCTCWECCPTSFRFSQETNKSFRWRNNARFWLSEVEKALKCCFVISIIKLSATGFNEKPWLNISEPLEQLSGNNLSQTEDIYK